MHWKFWEKGDHVQASSKTPDEALNNSKKVVSDHFKVVFGEKGSKPRISKAAQDLVLWLRYNDFYRGKTDDWLDYITFNLHDKRFAVVMMTERAANYYGGDYTPMGSTTLEFTEDENKWILWNADLIEQAKKMDLHREFSEVLAEEVKQ